MVKSLLNCLTKKVVYYLVEKKTPTEVVRAFFEIETFAYL